MTPLYICDRGEGTFPAALINFLSDIGDMSTAEKVGSTRRQFATTEDHVHPYLCTKIVHDSTAGQYQGHFRFSGIGENSLEQSLRELYGDKKDLALNTILQEIRAGRIRKDQKLVAYKGPGLLLIEPLHGKRLKWIVDTDKGYFVDSGYIKRYTSESQSIVGVMIVKHTEKPRQNNYFCDVQGRPLE